VPDTSSEADLAVLMDRLLLRVPGFHTPWVEAYRKFKYICPFRVGVSCAYNDVPYWHLSGPSSGADNLTVTNPT